MGSFIGLHLPVLMEVLIFMIQYTVVSLQVQLTQTKIEDDEAEKSLFLEVPAVQQQKRWFRLRIAYHVILADIHLPLIVSYRHNSNYLYTANRDNLRNLRKNEWFYKACRS